MQFTNCRESITEPAVRYKHEQWNEKERQNNTSNGSKHAIYRLHIESITELKS
eukprot:c19833_g1_i1 orf=107-265(+)